MTKKVISQLPGKPKPHWAHSLVIKAGDFVFTTGRGGGVDGHGRPLKGLEEQAKQSIENMKEMLQAVGATLADVVKLTIVLKNHSEWDNVYYALPGYFPAYTPPRTVHIASGLQPEGLITMDCIAYCQSDKSDSITKRVISQLPGKPNLQWNHSPVIKAGDFVFTTGRWGGGVDDQGRPIEGIEAQTIESIKNVEELLRAAGASLADAVKVTVLLKNKSDWDKMEEIYPSYFPKDEPTRTVHMVASSHAEGLIQTDCIAYSPSDNGGSITKTVVSQIPGRSKSGYPQSPVIKAGDFVFASGRGGLLDKQGKPLTGIEAQTKQCLENVKEMLGAVDAALSDVVKTTILLENPDDFDKMEQVYRSYFPKDQPTRTIYIASGDHLERGALFELDCIAYCPLHKE